MLSSLCREALDVYDVLLVFAPAKHLESLLIFVWISVYKTNNAYQLVRVRNFTAFA